jgi:hypothetical protein
MKKKKKAKSLGRITPWKATASKAEMKKGLDQEKFSGNGLRE